MGKTIKTYIGVTFVYCSMILKRGFWIILSILAGNVFLLLIESIPYQIVLSIFCFSGIFLLWFIDIKALSFILKLYSVPSSTLLIIKLVCLILILTLQIWSISIVFA